MPGPNVQDVVKDPDFLGLPGPERAKVLRQLDPDFAGMGQDEQLKAALRFGTSQPAQPQSPDIQRLAAVAKGAPAPGIGSEFLRHLQNPANVPAENDFLGREAMGVLRSPIDAVKGIAQTIAHPIDAISGIGHQVGQAIHDPVGFAATAQPENIGSMAGQALLGAGVGGAAKAAMNRGYLIPSTTRAGGILEGVESKIGSAPVDHAPALKVAERIEKAANAGGTMPEVVQKYLDQVRQSPVVNGTKLNPANPVHQQLINNLRQQGALPSQLDFQTARDFYKNSGLSTTEAMNSRGPIKAQLAQFRSALGSSIKDTAQQNGMGGEFTRGMQEYAQRSALNRNAKFAGKAAIKAAPIGIGGALLSEYLSGH